MIYSNYRYIDTAMGGVNKRNNVIDVTTLKLNGSPKADCYRTYFRFDKSYLNYFENKKSVMGFKGLCYTDFIPIDIDSTDLNEAWEKTNVLLNVLELDYSFEARHIFFSGSKGFHVYLPSVCFGYFKPANNLHEIIKKIVVDICGDYVEVDLKNYDQNRLFRMANTTNSKSGLYKIPITREQFSNGIEYIVDLAKNKQEQDIGLNDYVKNEQFVELYQKHLQEEAIPTPSGFLSKIKEGVGEGERDDTAIKIAGTLRKAGHDKEFTYIILSGWNKGNSPPLEEEEILKCVESAYRYSQPEQDVERELTPIWAVADDYRDFVRSSKMINLGFSFIDKKIRGLRPGQVMTILGFTGNFKSGFLQWVMRHYCQYSKEPVLLFQMEMSNLDLFERAMQMETGYSGREIEDYYKEKPDELTNYLKGKLSNFYVVDRPGLGFADMKDYLYALENQCKQKVTLVGIDFLQLMRGLGSTNVQMVDNVAKELKIFAKEMNVGVIALSQVTGIENEYSKISLMDSRDSKTIVQMSDYSVSIRLEEDTEDIQIVEILKNRKGGKGSGRIQINRKSLQFTEL